MSEESTTPGDDENGSIPAHPRTEPDSETPVGDMSEEGETDIGPYPSLTHLENIEPADLKDAAEGESDGNAGLAE